MQHKEHLLRYMMSGHIHVSKKDYNFFSNLSFIINEKKVITSNQSKLFDKLITKYSRQLKKYNNDIASLSELVWNTNVVESKQEFLEPYIFQEDETLKIRLPFNNKFIQSLHKSKLQPFAWDKNERLYVGNYSTFAFKLAYDLVSKHFSSFKLCPVLKEKFDQLSYYKDVLYWNPTLTCLNRNFYILGANPYLINAVSQITLNNEPKNLLELSTYGINIDQKIYETECQKFAGSFNYEIDLDNFDQLCKWLSLLEVDTVITPRDVLYNKSVLNEIKIQLLEHGIQCTPTWDTISEESRHTKKAVLLKLPSSIYRELGTIKFCKIITLTNSRSIKIS